MEGEIDLDDCDQVKRFLIRMGRGHPLMCIVRSNSAGMGDFVQFDNSPENTYERTQGFAVVVPFERPGLYGKIVSDPAWFRLPEGAIDKDNRLVPDKIPDWVTCLENRYYRMAQFEIAGDGTPGRG